MFVPNVTTVQSYSLFELEQRPEETVLCGRRAAGAERALKTRVIEQNALCTICR